MLLFLPIFVKLIVPLGFISSSKGKGNYINESATSPYLNITFWKSTGARGSQRKSPPKTDSFGRHKILGFIVMQSLKNNNSSCETASSNTRFDSLAPCSDDTPKTCETLTLPSIGRLYCHIDYLRFKFILPEKDFKELQLFLSLRMPYSIEEERQSLLGVERYHNLLYNLERSFVCGYNVSEEKVISGYYQLSGKYWENFDTTDCFYFLKTLQDNYDPRVLRLDLAIDDIDSIYLDNQDFLNAYEAKSFAGFQDLTYWEKNTIEPTTRTRCKSGTVYLGSRQSDRFVRIYKHDGIPRWELETKGEVSRKVWDLLVKDYPYDSFEVDSWQQAMASVAIGNYSFCDRSNSDIPIKDCPLLPFWEKFVNAVGGSIKISVGSASQGVLTKSISWLYRQVIMLQKELHYAFKKCGLDWRRFMRRLSTKASSRWNDKNTLRRDTFVYQLKQICGNTPSLDLVLGAVFPGERKDVNLYLTPALAV